MTGPEMWEYIAEQDVVHLGTISADGTPHMTTVWFAAIDHRIVFNVNYKSQKVRNIERDNRVTLMFSGGLRFQEQRGVMIKARAKLIRDRDRVLDVVSSMYIRRMQGLPPAALHAAAAHIADKRVVVVAEPERFATWDHSKVQ